MRRKRNEKNCNEKNCMETYRNGASRRVLESVFNRARRFICSRIYWRHLAFCRAGMLPHRRRWSRVSYAARCDGNLYWLDAYNNRSAFGVESDDVQCDECLEVITTRHGYTVDGDTLCPDCFHDRHRVKRVGTYPRCSICSERIRTDYLWRINGEDICRACLVDNYRTSVTDCI